MDDTLKEKEKKRRKNQKNSKETKIRWRKTKFGHSLSLSLKAFFLLSGTEKSLERRVKVTPGESTAGPRGRLLIQSLVVGSSLRIWTPSAHGHDRSSGKTKISDSVLFLSRFSGPRTRCHYSDASASVTERPGSRPLVSCFRRVDVYF